MTQRTEARCESRSGAPSGQTIWHTVPDLAQANALSAGCAIEYLGVELTELGWDHLTGRRHGDQRRPLRPVSAGWVTGPARPISLRRRSQVWEVKILDDDGRLVCLSRCTLTVIDAPR